MKWSLDCKLFPLEKQEEDALMQSLYMSALVINHDARYVLTANERLDKAEYCKAVESVMQGGAEAIAEQLDGLWAFCEETGQTQALESCRSYLIEGMKMKCLSQGYTRRALHRVAAATITDPRTVERLFTGEGDRLDKMGVPCECPVCVITSILEQQPDGAPAKVTEGMLALHDHIKSKAAFDDLLDSL